MGTNLGRADTSLEGTSMETEREEEVDVEEEEELEEVEEQEDTSVVLEQPI